VVRLAGSPCGRSRLAMWFVVSEPDVRDANDPVDLDEPDCLCRVTCLRRRLPLFRLSLRPQTLRGELPPTRAFPQLASSPGRPVRKAPGSQQLRPYRMGWGCLRGWLREWPARQRRYRVRPPWTSVPEARVRSGCLDAKTERKFAGSRSRTRCSSEIAHSERSQLRLPCDNVDTTSLCNPFSGCCDLAPTDLGRCDFRNVGNVPAMSKSPQGRLSPAEGIDYLATAVARVAVGKRSWVGGLVRLAPGTGASKATV